MAEVVPLTLTTQAALQMIRQLAAQSRQIVILDHCVKRMVRRHITRRQVELCLQKGSIVEGPFVNSRGNWQVNVLRHAAGEELTCTVAIEWATRLLVVTVY
jgi:Domain of unknown function (DUF4258)